MATETVRVPVRRSNKLYLKELVGDGTIGSEQVPFTLAAAGPLIIITFGAGATARQYVMRPDDMVKAVHVVYLADELNQLPVPARGTEEE